MKQTLLNEQGVTFTSALRTIKSASSLRKNGLTTLKESQCSLLRGSSFSNLIASSVRVTQRTNLTLTQLYAQYENNPSIDYVLHLNKNRMFDNQANSSSTFDSWIYGMNNDCIYTQASNSNKGKRQVRCDKVKRQIQENLYKISQKLNKRETEATQQSLNQQKNTLSKQQVKYSFSNYFSECSELQNKDSSNKLQIVTKVSLSSNEQANERIFQLPIKNAQRLQNICINKKINLKNNKQNIYSNINNVPNQQTKIVGLEFSKKTRFKSTKRKRKVDA